MTDVPQFPADVIDLLEAPIVAVLATRRRDDTVLLSPVWFEWRDSAFIAASFTAKRPARCGTCNVTHA